MKYQMAAGTAERAVHEMALLVPGTRVIVFDTETTGFDPLTNWVTQLSAIKGVVGGSGIAVEQIKSWLIKPPFPVPAELEEKGIGPSNEQLENAPGWDEVFPEVASFFDEEAVLIAHNTPFDVSFMNKMYHVKGCEFKCGGNADTLDFMRALHPEWESHKLGDCVNKLSLGGELKQRTNGKYHDSDTDVMATVLLCEQAMKEWPEMSKRKYVPAVCGCYLFDTITKDGVKTPVNHKSVSTRFRTNYGEIAFNHYRKLWQSQCVDFRKIDMARFETLCLKYIGVGNVNEIQKHWKNAM